MKRLVLAIALACALSSTALAGEVPTTGIVSSPPDETAIPGDVPSTGFTSPGDMPTCGWSALLTILGLAF